MNEYRFSDEIISHIARTLQMAILTGTDIVDNLRMIRLSESETDDGMLVMSPEYRAQSDTHIETLRVAAEKLQQENVDDPQVESQ